MTIEAAARFVAQSELALKATYEAEVDAAARAAQIAERIAATERRCDQVRADHAAKKLTDVEAGGLFALAQADVADLAELHRAAVELVGHATEQTRAAAAELSRAEAELSRAEAAAQFEALSEHAAELDEALCYCVSELSVLARRAGRPSNGLTAVFRPSSTLSAMIRLGQIPPHRETA